MNGLPFLYPELTLALLALGLLAADLFIAPKHGRFLYHLGWLATAVTICMVGCSISSPLTAQGVGSLWSVDPLSQYFKLIVLLTTVLCLLLGLEYKGLPEKHAGAFSALLLFTSLGMMFLVSAVDLLMIFIALELISISSFILVGFERGSPRSNEGALKYFLFGAFSSAVMIYGVSLYYGAAGTTSLLHAEPGGALQILGLLFILLGFGFKASIAPMHFWVPDAYEGAPTPVTAYLSVAPKIAAMAAVLRIFSLLIPASTVDLTAVLALLAMLTMTIGNFTALFQTNVKRLLAYSSVAQAGYILIGIVTGNALGLKGVLLYSAVYAAMNVGAFAVAIAIGNENSYELESFNGLAQRSLGMALAMAFCLLSLSGIPPLAGFVGKFYIFSSAMEAGRASLLAGNAVLARGFYALAVVGVVNSVVSVYYYMRIVFCMFLVPAKRPAPVTAGPLLYASLGLAVAAILLAGIYPEPLLAGVAASAHYLP